MSDLARRMIGEAAPKKPKMDWWERDREARRQEELADIRARYGRGKAEPDSRQARLIRLYYRRGEHRKLVDYCRSHGLNPNHTIATMRTDEDE